ncbi:metal-sensitive transcriptional regulator [Virgibacillus salexigens]|uniref:Copper-sensitive operon repressor n=2 Tax=Virgibacillus TaxID=84406 RepID=A0A024QER0_9BACI|nr:MULTISPECIES: metal-sensitive transcriptional regulator [Virgibacillus]MYL42560.1 metal-sensing transcriptional repressor [Virgibacillus massiliensis]GGJ74161.1 hypothetical protein GCM10007111_39670 [Virgibacillus kapii]CDQ40441.1 Copper-sensitive operon repressor [Virgibacillus massiliensis]
MKYDDHLKNRLKRMQGQVNGLIKMMEDEKDCREIVTQMSAVRSAIDRTAALVVSKNLEQCIRDEKESGESSEALIQEAVELLVKSR